MGKDKRQSPSTLLWFIRHKSYVPISEIRRRFTVDSEEGTFIDAGNHRRAYVGLPPGRRSPWKSSGSKAKLGWSSPRNSMPTSSSACIQWILLKTTSTATPGYRHPQHGPPRPQPEKLLNREERKRMTVEVRSRNCGPKRTRAR